ncbi:hypothetical protein A2478_02710 [Candidatus Falkowbacteria bacterium RIFOXYC2_FULL_36_12]|uniref:Uncharacterized protein n=1 Tax=Candidatus Falkowbacteria bacterium RIFOXYC2_FULL_36_12 TaxID=1798002 RepID=A0A1F5T169_9BACT|nr:MAG: hypothetical protein A2478_02710 [Candidatus Falkowbacteria bacterium RIFOXYC2_FULL_36_12]
MNFEELYPETTCLSADRIQDDKWEILKRVQDDECTVQDDECRVQGDKWVGKLFKKCDLRY